MLKNQLMTNSANNIQMETKIERQKLGTVTSLKYLGACWSGQLSWFGHISRPFWLLKTILQAHENKAQVDRRGGKTIIRRGQGWTLLALRGQLKTGLGGKGLLKSHLWCPNDLASLWDRLD